MTLAKRGLRVGFRGPLSVLFVGDSLPADAGAPSSAVCHYPRAFARINPHYVVVIAAGVSGAQLSSIYTRLLREIPKGPRVGVWEGGVNDIISNSSDPNTAMRATTTAGLAAIKGAGAVPVAVNVGCWKNHASWTATKQGWTDSYNDWLLSYCTQNSFEHYDLHTALEDPITPDALWSVVDGGDGLHFFSNGHAIVATDLSRLINRRLSWLQRLSA